MPLHILQFVVIGHFVFGLGPLSVCLDTDTVLFDVTFYRAHAECIECARLAFECLVHRSMWV